MGAEAPSLAARVDALGLERPRVERMRAVRAITQLHVDQAIGRRHIPGDEWPPGVAERQREPVPRPHQAASPLHLRRGHAQHGAQSPLARALLLDVCLQRRGLLGSRLQTQLRQRAAVKRDDQGGVQALAAQAVGGAAPDGQMLFHRELEEAPR